MPERYPVSWFAHLALKKDAWQQSWKMMNMRTNTVIAGHFINKFNCRFSFFRSLVRVAHDKIQVHQETVIIGNFNRLADLFDTVSPV